MKRLNIADSDVMEIALQNEIFRSEEARYEHRLHGVLLVCRGFKSYEVAKMFWSESDNYSTMGPQFPKERFCWIGRLQESRKAESFDISATEVD